ncbi:FAD-dependent oxidoreductase [Sphingobium chungangianum]
MSAVSKVLVVGGGIGGLCAAVALRQQGIEVDLIEKNPAWTVYGVGIIQPNNTLRALDRIGLAQACAEQGAGYPGWRICDASGALLFEAPATSDAAPAYPPINGITRPRLHQILVDAATAHGARIRLGTTAETLDDQGERVEVAFSDGERAHYDFVIGCDGLYSDIRNRLFGDALRPQFTGQGVWRYNLPRPADAEWGALFFGPDSKAGIVPMSADAMYLLLVTHEPGNPMMAQDGLAEAMRTRMQGYSGIVADYRDQIVDDAGVVYRPMENLMLPAPWHRGRTVVIGDAAHATTPHLAQGAAMAIEDAVLLGELLGQDRALDDLLGEFMERRFARAKYVVDASSQIAAWELEEWNGAHNPDARPGELLHEATIAMMQPY